MELKEITIEESKKIQIELLKCLHKFCEANGLEYYIMFGTLIGAVRHKGFIPWDDDIDVVMPRKDYNTLINSFMGFENVDLICCENDKEYYLPFGKLIDTRTVLKEHVDCEKTIGVYIDIFPMDYQSDDLTENIKVLRKMLYYRNKLCLKILPGSNKRTKIRQIEHFVLRKIYFKNNMNDDSIIINKLAQSFNNKGSSFYRIWSNIHARCMSMSFPCDLFQNRELLTFENEKFYAPQQYDTILKMFYGDYMVLPPKEQQVIHHEYKQYWK